ncbi:nuclear pore complex protein NUP98A [Neltuma alba]|uniref:nuclear pore complex protein NUP98A n=1 Tax=Neltuma alba TaxID=207710 RepID=UPI0010A4ABF6|nr:nuclear pore complex protein NUP98A [Prosopis alba]
MFGSTNPFGQSSSSPFGSQSVFGQTNASSSNPFAPKPFGSTTPFGSQTSSSLFGGTSTGVFGASPSSSPFSSTNTFGASSSPAFGSSVPAFGSSSTSAFGNSSSSFAGSSVFGQKPAFGSFGSTTQTSPFGSAGQPSQPAFGSSIFGSSTPFGASSQPTFGPTSTPAFGSASTPAFGSTSTPTFGSTSTPAFGSTSSPTFGSTGSAFGVSSSGFGAGGGFGAPSTPFGSSTTSFGTSSTPAFGASSTPGFGASSTPSFSFGPTQTFGQSTPAFGSSPFGSTSSPFGGQSSPFGSQSTSSAFGSTGIAQSGFGGQRSGSRVVNYAPTAEADGGTSGQTAKLESISAMPVYKDKSHEELRWEDYQTGDKGGAVSSAQSTGLAGFNSSTPQANTFAPSPAFGQSAANPFSTSTPSNPFAAKSSPFSTGFGATSTPAFSSSAFGTSTSAAAPSIFGSSTSTFGNNSPSPLFSSSALGTSSPFGSSINFGNTQSSNLFSSAAPTIAQTGSGFGQSTSLFGQNTSAFSQSSLFNSSSSGLGGNIFPSSAPITSSNLPGFGQTPPSISTPFQTGQAAQTSGTFAFSNFGQTQPAGGTPSLFGQSNFGPSSSAQSPAVVQAAPISNPFGTLPALPHMSIGRAGTTPSIQYGISSMPVTDKPPPVKVASLLTSRHLSQRRIKFPVRKYHPKNDGPKVPFFGDDEDTPTTPKADALYIPRENPRALIIHHAEQWATKAYPEKTSFRDRSTAVNENGINTKEAGTAPTTDGNNTQEKATENGFVEEQVEPSRSEQTSNGTKEDHSLPKGNTYMTLSGHRAGEAAIVYEHGADIEALMPKLRQSDYYTLPRIQELAAKERAEPGFCSRVKDFVVGRHGYGCIKFFGETDVRRLDLDSLVEFNYREVVVYRDETKKPPVGQGLNKPAEVTLLNIKCLDKKTGREYTGGPKVEKYKEMLKKKAEDQGAEFLSYDATKGEWKIRVNHFSSYKLTDEGDSWDEC